MYMVFGGAQPLHMACMGGHGSAVSLLLHRRACLDTKTRDGSRAIHLAASASSTGALKALIAHRADLTAKGGRGFIVLDACTTMNKVEALRLLLAQGVSLARHENGLSVLHLAMAFGCDPDVVHALVAARCSVQDRAQPKFGTRLWVMISGCSWAYRLGRRDPYTLIFYHMRGSTPLLTAMAAGRLSVARTLLGHRADIRDRTARGLSALELVEATGLYSAPAATRLLGCGSMEDLSSRMRR